MAEANPKEDSRKIASLYFDKCVSDLRLRHRVIKIRVCDQEDDHNKSKITPSTTLLKDLRVSFLSDIYLGEVATGKVLSLRTLERAKKVNGITTLVEDLQGNVVIFCIYNFTEEFEPDLSDILPVGTVFFLKEPLIALSDEGYCFLRCDCPSDMVVVSEGHSLYGQTRNITWVNVIDYHEDEVRRDPLPTDAPGWTERGDELFGQGKFRQASRCYCLALEKLEGSAEDDITKTVKLKLATAHYKLGFFDKALSISNDMAHEDGSNIEANIVTGRSYYQLRYYSHASEHFQKVVDNGVDVLEELSMAKKCAEEMKTGNFDMFNYFSKHDGRCGVPIDCGDYFGPMIRLDGNVEGSRPSIAANVNIEPGTLLMVSKAMAFSWKSNSTTDHDELFETGSRRHLVAQLAQMIAKNTLVFGLYIYGINENGPITAFCDRANQQEPIVDVGKIQEIVRKFAFGRCVEDGEVSAEDGDVCAEHQWIFPLKDGCGVFEKPSFFRHSCLPNAVGLSLGNVLFIRAITFIAKDEEIFLPYISWEVPFLCRTQLCEKRQFKCRCAICLLDRLDPKQVQVARQIMAARKMAIDDQITEENWENVKLSITQIKELMNQLDDTYGDVEQFPPFPKKAMLSSLCVSLSKAYTLECQTGVWEADKQLECYEMHLKLRGFDMWDVLDCFENDHPLINDRAYLDATVLQSIVGLIKIYSRNLQHESKNQWISVLCALEMIYSGCDVRVVKLKYKDIEHLL